jgi:hypothetical protein
VTDIHPLQDAVSVYIPEEGKKLVERRDIVPLEELRALQKKSAEPCDRHDGDEPCECGAKPGKKGRIGPRCCLVSGLTQMQLRIGSSQTP